MISPSMMETKFLSQVYEAVVEQSAAANPMKRNASPADVAGLIEYLFSDANIFVTGANIPITGGEEF
jgi:3-oxoacyl-[acyl-carrier protein] reductase